MLDDGPPIRDYKHSGVVIFMSGGGLTKAPENFNRNEKLAYVENAYKLHGNDAFEKSTYLMEIKISRGLSGKAFNNARDYGLYWFNKRENK